MTLDVTFTTPGLSFDEERHEYHFDGKPVVSVTQGLRVIGIDYSKFNQAAVEYKRALGTAVHRMVELDIRRDLDEEALTGPLVGYFKQWRAFLAASKFVPRHCELKLYSRRYCYAGTLDLFGSIGKFDVLMDTKAGLIPITCGEQLAGYENLCIEHGITTKAKRFALDLKETSWQLSTEYKNPADLRTFLACITVAHWLNKNRRGYSYGSNTQNEN